MNIAHTYFQKQLKAEEFRHAYLEEKAKFDIEYQLEELKQAIQARQPIEELIQKIDYIERYVMAVTMTGCSSPNSAIPPPPAPSKRRATGAFMRMGRASATGRRIAVPRTDARPCVSTWPRVCRWHSGQEN